MDPGHLRIVDPDGSVSVRDFVAGKEITIFPQSKTASRVSRVYYEKERLTKYIDWIESLHKSAARFVGQKDLNGKLTNVFTFDRLFEHYTIWTDPVTNLPFQVERIELPSPDKDVKPSQISLFLSDFCDKAGGRPIGPDPVRNIVSWRPGTRTRKVTTTMTGFSWDVPLDESLFGVTVPDGYKVVDEVDWGAPPEDRQALIESLRFWAEASDGDFPADINMLLDARPKLIRKFHENGPAELEYAAALKMAQVVVNGACFAQTQEAQGNWYYAGGDVRLGQADKPLCWWLNDDGATYCVIYGDLSSRDVTACRIPSHVQ
jgi:hypothetical protein